MRRPAPTLQLSPRVIRQFALITLIVTALLAMFSSGENAEVAQMIKDREAKTRLAQIEASKLGARKVGSLFRQERQQESGEGFEKLNEQEGGGSTASMPNPAGWAGVSNGGAQGPAFLQGELMQPLPADGRNMPKRIKVRPVKQQVVTKEQREAMIEASLRRSGVQSSADAK